ncbi:hypothetical protein PENANT_c030G04146 [Penicillium antarcticum]|uniref:HTH araC/xylS-type domain-containing protein n=1 Tax=Penicillium antarcticum TaxID=416450 RepID=A0A1V6PVI0_9EURO|nr:uncharacterized protein N7508_001478 [Penicillium antarcticum]KAJ5316970.1 hypothetical protein N7508_001478 [Penicillium antarcticum]OQD80953.1 hypothetical protein PENANT_c030G04146 [Penicillium antarcticum]
METQTQASSSGLSQSSNARWLALTHRNRSSHSSFLYGVKSTKIYCRPTCPARLARRANVVFYDTAEQARCDGFRPCKRCQPDNAEFAGDREEVVTKVIELLRVKKDNLTMKLGLKELAKEVGVTPSYLCRVFKKTMGITVGTYLMEFEKEPSEDGTESSARTPSQFGSDVSLGTGLPFPATQESSRGPFDDLQGDKSKAGIVDIAEALDLNFNFDACCANLDDQFWTEDYWTEDSWNAGFWNEGSLY